MKMRSVWLYALLFLGATASAAQVYRYVDANGNVTYSDKPAGQDVEMLFIDTSTSTPLPTGSDEADSQEAVTVDNTPEPESVGPTDEEIAAERMENCGIARDREARYIAAHRIYRGTEEEREYLTDAELVEIRAQAAADVDEWCN
jgi:hypothetical protein